MRLLGHFWTGGNQGRAWEEWIGLVAVGLAVIALSLAKLPGYLNVYTASVFLILFESNQGFRVRLLTWAFPALIAAGKVLTPRSRLALIVLFAGLLPMVFVAYTTLGNTMIQP